MDVVRWGIVGPGRIAHKFAEALKVADGAVLTAVSSREESRARAFAEQYGASYALGSHDELALCPDVDAVYIATPHPFHAEPARICLEHGKAVLCEKPFTVSARELEPLIALAREKGVFLMEAMWTRFLPIMEVVRGWIDEGRIGEPRIVQAGFGFRGAWNPDGRLLNPALAGGALLDVGVYPISFSHWVFGAAPVDISGEATIGETGVDEQMTAALKFPGGRLGSLTAAVRTETGGEATIYGTSGRIRVSPRFHEATSATLIAEGGQETEERPFRANGFEFQIEEVCRCLRDGLMESPGMTLQDSLEVMRTMDTLRSQWGLRYPFEGDKQGGEH